MYLVLFKMSMETLVSSKRSMRFNSIPKHQQRHLVYDSLQNRSTEPCSNHMGIIFLVIHEVSWISNWFLFFPLMKFVTVTLKLMRKLLLSIYWPDYWLDVVLSVKSFGDTGFICHYHHEVSSCIWVWPSRTGW